jgi:CDK inhibitor PHO81
MPLRDLFSGGDPGSSSHRAPSVTSPSSRSPAFANGATAASHNITLSSLSGEFVHAVVQVTRDLVPVIYSDWNLPFDGIDAGVADVTVDQFHQLGVRLKKSLPEEIKNAPSTAAEWHRFISGKLCTLQLLLQVSF